MNEDHVGLIAAGVALYGLSALFLAITALIAIAELVLAPGWLADQMEMLSAILPKGAA